MFKPVDKEKHWIPFYVTEISKCLPSCRNYAGCIHLSRWETLPLILQGVYNPSTIREGKTCKPKQDSASMRSWSRFPKEATSVCISPGSERFGHQASMPHLSSSWRMLKGTERSCWVLRTLIMILRGTQRGLRNLKWQWVKTMRHEAAKVCFTESKWSILRVQVLQEHKLGQEPKPRYLGKEPSLSREAHCSDPPLPG